VLVVLVGGVFLIHAIVREVHVLGLVATSGAWAVDTLCVFASGESRQALLVNVDPQRVDASNGHIDAHVKLVAVQKERVADVLGHDVI